MTIEAEEEDQLAEATKAAKELDELLDTHFIKKPNDKIVEFRARFLMLLDSIPLERREVPAQQAVYKYLRGKILGVVPYYRKEVEDLLSEAVKLNPSLVDAWLCLGDCIWKRGDLSAAKDCFIIGLNKGPNKKILCRLSSLTIKMTRGADNKAELIKESIQFARKAITLDVKCGNSWLKLGNAYVTSFFATGGADRYILMQSFKAYENAEKDERLKFCAELHYNSATACKYLENFDSALTRFEAAAALLNGDHKILEIIQDTFIVLEKLDNALKEYARAKKLGSLVSDLASIKLSFSPYRRVTIDTLSEGPNKGAAILAKVLSFIKHGIIPTLYYLICDSETECFVLSVYRLQYNMFKRGDQLILLEPVCSRYDFSWKGREYKFKLIRLDYINQVIVNGKKLFQPQDIISTSTARSHSCSSTCTLMPS